MDRARRHFDIDKIGSVASFLCVIHCALTGFLVGILPIVGAEFLGSVAAELCFFGAAASIGTLAIVRGFRQHRSYVPGIMFALGLTTIGVGHALFSGTSRIAEAGLSILGGATLIGFHLLNARLPRRCYCEYCLPADKVIDSSD